ncbi:MAG: Cna B-type domain-containing protein, partial [Peptococcaceae bacterium]|nr:Cna B-type domain-containing protein [Peptococcaceae bacterium]
FTFSGDATVKGTDAGSYPMQLKPADFTNTNTNFSNVEFVIVDGTLEIAKRSVTLTSATDSKVYDGTALTNNTVTVTGDGFATGEGAAYDVTGSQTVVGSSANTFTYTLNAGTKAANYEIDTVEGTLTVTKIMNVIVITAASDEKVYDGKPLTNDGYTYTEGILVAGDVLIATVEGSQTEVGSSPNKVTGYKVIRGGARSLAAGTDVTANYTFGESIDGTLTVTPKYTDLTVTKVWDDADNQDGKRPAELTVTLSKGQEPVRTVTLNAENQWTATAEGVLEYEIGNGQLIEYTWTEAVVDGYELTNYVTNGAVTTLTNTHETDTTSVSGQKIWKDNSDQDGLRPANIFVYLLADGVIVDSKTVSGSGNVWNYTFANLPTYANGEEIVYTVMEEDVPYYTTSIDGYTITNAYEPETTEIIGEKIWDDNDNKANARPESIVVELFADGVQVDRTTVTALDWSYAFTDLPVYKDGGQAIAYRVVEDPESAPGYVPSYSVEQNNNGYVIDITNTYSGEDAEFVTISGNKVWNDNNDEQGKRPESIILNLLRDGKKVDEITVTEADNWAYAFTNLPKADEEGNAYEYTVTEDAVDEYRSVITRTSAGYDITNTLITGEAGQIQVTKVVSGDEAPKDGIFGFVLKIEASAPDWTALKVYHKLQLEEAYEEAVEKQAAAEKAWEDAKAEFAANAKELRTTGSAIQFAMAEEVTSPSCYEYLMIDEDARITSTTSSSYNFAGLAAGKADASLVDQVIEAIRELAAEFSRANSVFLKALQSEVSTTSSALEFTTPSALGFMKDDAQNLLNKADRLFEAEALVKATSESVYEFVNSDEVTTPSAITLIITDANGNVSRQEMSNEEGQYEYRFDLKADETYSFAIETTTGSSIKYAISEIQWDTDDYEETKVTLNGTDVTSNGVRYTGVQELTSDIVNDVVFTNIYDDYTPYFPPYEPEPKPEPEPEIIPEPEVPAGEPPVVVPGEEIMEEEIPLGDAPRTGDVNDAMPFMAMMLFALTGMVITRRKFN